jgi:hypothetical protein
MLEARAFILFAPCDAPKIVRRPCIVPKGRPRSMLVSRRSRRARLLGAGARARLSTLAFTAASGSVPSSARRFRDRRPSALRPPRSRPRAPGRVHLLVPAVLASRRSRATLHRLTVHGLANSCHVSTRAGDDPLPFEGRARTSHPAIAPALAFRRWRLPSRRPRAPCLSYDIHVSQPPTMILSNHRCACIHLSFGTGSRCSRVDRRLSTLTTRRHFRAHVRATCP